MKHYLLNHQPQKGLQAACAQQGQAPTCNARGKGHTSASPKTLTKIILVLLTMILLPSAAWGVDEYTLGSGETLTYNNVSKQYSSLKGLVWNVSLTNIPNSSIVPKYNNDGFSHFCELRLTSPIPYKGTMSGFTFSGGEGIFGGTYGSTYIKYADQILVYKFSAPDFSDRTKIGEVTGDSYTYNSTSSQVLDNEYLQVVILRTSSEAATYDFPSNKITGIAMTFEGTSYGIKVGNQRVTSNNYDDIFKDGGKVSYNSADNTLTLNGATIDGCIRYSGNDALNIKFEGNNTITAVDSAAIWTVYDSNSTPSQLPSLILSGSGNAKLSSGSYLGYSAIAGFSQINGGLSAAYLVDYAEADFTNLSANKDLIICNGRPYGFYVGGTIVTASNKATVLGSGVDFTPATSDVATLTFSDKATIPGELEWDLNNALKIQLSGANAVQGCIHSNKDVALSFTYPSGATNSTLTFGNSEGTQSAISGFREVTFPAINSPGDNKLSFDENVSYSDKALKNDKNEVVTSSHISYYYGLTIAGVAVTSSNVDSDGKITGIDGAKFAAPATLTLEDAGISYTSGNAIETEIDNLIIELKGNNTIATDEGNYALFGNGNNKITLSSNQEGSLTLENNYNKSGGGLVQNITIEKSDDMTLTILDPTNVTTLEEAKKAIYTKGTPLGLTVNNVIVTTNNKDNIQEGVRFDSDNNKLVLTNAIIDGSVVWDTNADLYIEINGENSIGEILATTGTSNIIHFTEGNSTGDKTVVISETISGFDGFPDLGTSLYNIESGSKYATITTAAYDLKVFVNGKLIQVQKYSSDYPGYKDNIKGEATATVTFDGDHTLTLNEGTISENTSGDNSNTSIVSGLNNLTIKLLGDGYYSSTIEGKIKSTNPNAILTFTSEDNGSLFIGNGDPIEDFKGNPSFKNGLVYLPYGQSVGVNIKKLNIPSMRLVDGNLTLDNYGDEWNEIKCAYTIEYTDGTKETGEYNPDQPKAINKPCVVTAHAVYEDIFGTTNTGDDAVGKYFGAKQEVFGMAIGDKIEGTDWFVPAISTDDGLSCDFTSESGVFTSENGVLSAVESGTGIVSATLEGPSNTPYTILNGSYAITLVFNVGEDLDEYFVDDNEYGTYYNEEENITYAVPEGMKAYIIKSVSDDGTVDLAESTVLSPKTPLLLKKGTAKSFTKISTSTGSAPSGNILLYTGNTDVKATEGSNLYVLYNDKFVKVTTDTRILSQKCYLDLSSLKSSGTRSYYDIDGSDGTTGIREVKSEGVKGEKLADSAWHDLQGRKFTTKPTKPGLYILNGKKVVIK